MHTPTAYYRTVVVLRNELTRKDSHVKGSGIETQYPQSICSLPAVHLQCTLSKMSNSHLPINDRRFGLK